jgi:hypothetical protein
LVHEHSLRGDQRFSVIRQLMRDRSPPVEVRHVPGVVAPRLDAAFDDRGDQFFAAADGSSESAVGSPARIVLPSPADESVSLLPVTLGECERLGRAAVMLAGLLGNETCDPAVAH